MTSEQKEAFLNSWFGSLPECSSHWMHGMSGKLADEVSSRFDEAIQAYTRTVPDVTELVRYEPNHKTYPYFEMEEDELGEYVRYDQASAIIAAKDAEIATHTSTGGQP